MEIKTTSAPLKRAKAKMPAAGLKVPPFSRQVASLRQYMTSLDEPGELDDLDLRDRVAWMMGFPDAKILQSCVKANRPWRQVNEPAPLIALAHPEYVQTETISVADIRAVRPDLTVTEAWESLLATLLQFSYEDGYTLCCDSVPRQLECELLPDNNSASGLPCVLLLDDGTFRPPDGNRETPQMYLPRNWSESYRAVRIAGLESPLSVSAGKLLGGDVRELASLVDRLAETARLPPLSATLKDPPGRIGVKEKIQASAASLPLLYIPGHLVPWPEFQVRQLHMGSSIGSITRAQAEEATAQVMGFRRFDDYVRSRGPTRYPESASLNLHWTIDNVRRLRADLTKKEAAHVLEWQWEEATKAADRHGLSTYYFDELLANFPNPWPDMEGTAYWEVGGVQRSVAAVLEFGHGVARIDTNSCGSTKLRVNQRGQFALMGTSDKYAFGPRGPQLEDCEITRLIDALEEAGKLPER